MDNRSRTVLGLITTGMGPRDEYVQYHQNLLRHLGIDVEIQIRHALDGLSLDELRAMESRLGDRFIGCHVRIPGAEGDRMGPGWGHIWATPEALAPRFQDCLTELESAGADVTILCCAEEYPEGAFQSERIFVLPWRLLTTMVRTATDTIAHPRVGILVPDEEHLDQDRATWRSEPWMERLGLVVESKKGRLQDALATMRAERVHFVVNWGYGYGIAPDDPSELLEQVESTVGVPFLTIQRAVTLYVRNFLQPSLDDNQFARPPLVAATAEVRA